MTLPAHTIATDQPTLTRAHKAAVILATLNPETASAIVEGISDAHLKSFALAFSDLKPLPQPLLHAIAHEFIAEVERSATSISGGAAAARKILETFTGGDRVNRIFENGDGGASTVWRRLADVKAEALLPYLLAQRKSVAAVIISKLDLEKAARIFSLSEPQFTNSLLIELARGKTPAQASIDSIAMALEEDFLKPLAAAPAEDGMNEIVGEIINLLPSAKRESFLSHLDSNDQKMARAVRSAVVSFEDIHQRINEAGAAMLLRTVEKAVLISALKHGQKNAPEATEFILANVSKRMADQYREEIASMEELSDGEGESAQRDVMKILRRLARNGDIKLAPAAASI